MGYIIQKMIQMGKALALKQEAGGKKRKRCNINPLYPDVHSGGKSSCPNSIPHMFQMALWGLPEGAGKTQGSSRSLSPPLSCFLSSTHLVWASVSKRPTFNTKSPPQKIQWCRTHVLYIISIWPKSNRQGRWRSRAAKVEVFSSHIVFSYNCLPLPE